MKKVTLFIIIVFFISCNNSNNVASNPDVCNCVENIMKSGTDDFNENLNKRCQEYSATLTPEQRVDRAMEGLKCISE
mgnify:CR=1 FL=1